MSRRILIGIAGGSGSGKTLVARNIVRDLGSDRVVIIDRGQLVTISPLDELTARMAGGVRLRAPRIQAFIPVIQAAGFEATLSG